MFTNQPQKREVSVLLNEITNSIGMKLVLIKAGAFMMGSPENEMGRYDDEAQHEVVLTQDFYLGVSQVTQAQYEEVMGENPSYFEGEKVAGVDSSEMPVEMVSWEESMEFCRKLSALPEERSAGRAYRLPSEAQWEYACRAGNTTVYSFGCDTSDLGKYAIFVDNSGRKTHPVGHRQPNAWGLFDMHGNVWEWCLDWYADYSADPVTDPMGPETGSIHVYRGGSWSNKARDCRSAIRLGDLPSYRIHIIGFRASCVSTEQ